MMKAKIVILTPVYNDWKNLTKLLTKINNIFKYRIKKKFDLIVINDCSSKDFSCKRLKLKNVNKLTLISLSKNVGSQRALAIGIKYINKTYKKNYKTIIIDSDGQDNPEAIIKMMDKVKKDPEYSVVANRGQRKESFWFKFLYEIYCILINCLAVKKIRFGNYSLINSSHMNKIHDNSDLWSAFPPTVSNNIKKISYITVDRDKRFSGKSKMNFFGLLIHASRVFSVLRYRIIASSSFYLLVAYIFLYNNKYELFFYTIFFFIFLFNITNFATTLSNKINFNESFKKAKIYHF